jgi:pyruvate kinase
MKMDVDFVSVACLRDQADIQELRMILGNSEIKVMAAIENQRGMDNFESILKFSDGIVIDRGYLGAEMDLELVVIAQKKMISLGFLFLTQPIVMVKQSMYLIKF